MGLIKQLDRRSGITYVYENYPYWDKVTKTHRAHRKLIGRYNPETGEIVPTDGRCRSRAKPDVDPQVPLMEQLERANQQHQMDLLLISTLQKENAPREALVEKLQRDVQRLTEERDIAVDRTGTKNVEVVQSLHIKIDALTVQKENDAETIRKLQSEITNLKAQLEKLQNSVDGDTSI